MVTNPNFFYVSPEVYLEGERVSPIKHEYRKGRIYAMVGAKKPHIVLNTNLATLLNIHLDDSPCLVLTSDIKVRLEEANCYYYPDIAVVCDEREINNTDDFILYPVLIIEVLSKSTESFDRGDKKIECHRREDSGIWKEQIYEAGDAVEFTSVGFRGSLASIYRKVPGLV
ncbi:MAG: Uma2 family endonuclease [Microcystis sp. 53602_E8]|nr:Uma2 family endonuclease [Microcystis sp. 53602_E8]